MPDTGTLQQTLTVGSNTYVQTFTTSATNLERISHSVPAAKVGQLTTRTDADTGVLTMVTGHGFSTSDKVDVFWEGGSRHGMDATVATNAVTVDGGSGDDLPTNLTAVTAMKPVPIATEIDGDDVLAIGVYSPKAGYVAFVDAEDNEIAAAVYQLDANEGKSWLSGNGVTNPLNEAAVAKVAFSHGYSGGAATMRAEVLFGTPP